MIEYEKEYRGVAPRVYKYNNVSRDDRGTDWWWYNFPESRLAGPGTNPWFSQHDGRTNEQRERDILRHRFWMDFGRELGLVP